MTLEDILINSFDASAADVNDQTRLMSLPGWDSMAHMFFITKLEESYEIVLTGDEIAAMETVGAVKNIIISKGKHV